MFSQSNPIPVGQRYQDARSTISGEPSRTVWVVERILYVGDIKHVELVDECDNSRSKVIAMSTLAEQKLYVPLSPYSSSPNAETPAPDRLGRIRWFLPISSTQTASHGTKR